MKQIIVCGVLCNLDIALAELLCRYGFNVMIARHVDHPAPEKTDLAGELLYFSMKNIKYYKSPWAFYQDCLKAGCVLSINGYYSQIINLKTELYSSIFNFPKIINLTCGSDITELAFEKSYAGAKYRRFLKKCVFNYISPYPAALQNFHQLKINHYSIARFPFFLLGKRKEVEMNGEIKIFHPSNLDWGVHDKKQGRNSTKGNIKFISALLKSFENGLNATCTILFRGPDREVAKKIIQDSPYGQRFNWHESLSSLELREMIREHDVIVDQFDVGGIGGIAVESMAQGKPVMMYMEKNCWPFVYFEEPPIINCHTERDIYAAMIEWFSDRRKLQHLGNAAEAWVRKYHDIQHADFIELIYRVCLIANLKWPRVDLLKAEHVHGSVVF